MRFKIVVVTALLLISFVPPAHAASKKPLDGTLVSGNVSHPDEAKPDPDTLIFKDGTVRSTACDEYGFGPGSYTTGNKGDAITFDATTKNKEGNTILWHGIVSGEKVTATGLWSDKNGKTDTFAFTGTVKK